MNRWYENGLRFTCLRGCTDCCRQEGVIVAGSVNDVSRMADYLSIGIKEMPVIETDIGFTVRNHDDGCALIRNNGCGVYPVRPARCRSFPFWPEYLVSQDTWTEVQKRCAGIGIGHLYLADEIEAMASGDNR